MNTPDNLMYTKNHEWILLEGSVATVGVTDHAQEQMGDIVFAELPKEGEAVTKGETFGVLESVKAVSDCYSPLSGKVVEANSALVENPEMVNEDAYGEGWMIKIEVSDTKELEDLMDHNTYKAFIAEESK